MKKIVIVTLCLRSLSGCPYVIFSTNPVRSVSLTVDFPATGMNPESEKPGTHLTNSSLFAGSSMQSQAVLRWKLRQPNGLVSRNSEKINIVVCRVEAPRKSWRIINTHCLSGESHSSCNPEFRGLSARQSSAAPPPCPWCALTPAIGGSQPPLRIPASLPRASNGYETECCARSI